MFDRCDVDTMAIVDGALDEARRLGHNYLGTEHLLVALVRRPDLLPDGVAALLPTETAVLESLLEVLDRPPEDDATLLANIGIDLEAMRSAVGQSFGDDAIERLGRRRVHQPWQPWRRPRRRCVSLLGGSMGVAPRVKQAFELAAGHVDRRHRATIDPAGLLLGMVEVEDAMSNRLLWRVGVDPGDIRRALIDDST